MGTVTVTPANGYSRRGMSVYRAVGTAAAATDLTITVLKTFLLGDIGDCWGTTYNSNVFSNDAGTVQSADGGYAAVVKGARGSHNLVRSTAFPASMPTYDKSQGSFGSMRFNGVSSERFNDPSPEFAVPLSSPFTFICHLKVIRGYGRAVMVTTGANDVWFDYRLAQNYAAGWVQQPQNYDSDAAMPKLSGITGAGTGWVLMRMQRDVSGGNAVAYCGTQSAVVTAGTTVGSAVIRIFEDHDTTNHDFLIHNPYLNARGLVQADVDNVVAWSAQGIGAAPPTQDSATIFNIDDRGAGIILSGGNQIVSKTAATWTSVRAKNGKTAGIQSYTTTIDTLDSAVMGIGVSAGSVENYCGVDGNSFGYYANTGDIIHGGVTVATIETAPAGSVIKIEYDGGAKTMKVSIGGVLKATISVAALTAAVFPMVSPYGNTVLTADFTSWPA